jgi:hypothetical protein
MMDVANVLQYTGLSFGNNLLGSCTNRSIAVMGLKKDLKFKENEFSHVASAYAIAHLVMQGPNGMLTAPL